MSSLRIALSTPKEKGVRKNRPQGRGSRDLLGTTLRLSGSASDAPSHYRQALRLLDDIGGGVDRAVQRADFNPI
jgi:hypothetical protein